MVVLIFCSWELTPSFVRAQRLNLYNTENEIVAKGLSIP